MSMDNDEGMPDQSHVGRSGPLGGVGIGWQGSGIDFEVQGPGPWSVSAWDEDVCVASFTTRHRAILLVRLWLWHWKFNRTGSSDGERSQR